MAIIQPFFQEQKYIGNLSYLLKIFSINNRDELGTPEFWEGKIKELYDIYGWKKFFNNEYFEIWHWLHKDLCTYLKDYDPNTSGDQRACGINIAEYVYVGVNPADINLSSDEYKAQVLSHEFWHSVSAASQIFDKKTWTQVGLYNLFVSLLAKLPIDINNGLGNIYEKWAELGKCFFGTALYRDMFSDHKIFKTAEHTDLYTLMKLAECLNDTLGNSHITDIEVHSSADKNTGVIYGWITYIKHNWFLWWDTQEVQAIDTYFNLYKDNGRGGWTSLGCLNV